MKVWFKQEYFWLGLVLIIGFAFRTYNFEKGFSYAHDADLYSWIAKDILSGHQRLVGQLTSVDGVFIGSFYYYLMAIFYRIFNMNPMGAVFPLTVIGLFDIWSVYFIFKKHFGKKVGLIGCFLWATSWGVASFERWSVPTEPTMTWSIWFLAVILELYKGNLKYIWLYGFLAGFTWQLHIALLPILPIPIIGYFLGKNKFKNIFCKDTVIGILVFLISISPFVMFEVKHNFSQIKSMMVGINKNTGGLTGMAKLNKVIVASGKEFQVRLIEGMEQINPYIVWLLILMSVLIVNLDYKLKLLFGLWVVMIMLAQFVSKRIVSEYYFSNFVPVVYLFLALLLSRTKKFGWLMLVIFLIANVIWIVNRSTSDNSYYFRNQLVNEIQKDVVKNKYNCIAINYIADPGVGVGFRYLFWYKGINLVKAGTANVPIYNISIPWQTVADENPMHFGRFGVLLPAKEKGVGVEECSKKVNQIDPLLGYTD